MIKYDDVLAAANEEYTKLVNADQLKQRESSLKAGYPPSFLLEPDLGPHEMKTRTSKAIIKAVVDAINALAEAREQAEYEYRMGDDL